MVVGARGKAVAALMLLLALMLAGCSGKGNSPSSTSSSTPASGSATAHTPGATPAPSSSATSSPTTSPSSSSPPPHTNHAPVVRAFSASRANATTLRFTFAMNGSDPDGDTLTWSLDPTGNGTRAAAGSQLPATAVFTYAAVGNYTATFAVSDGALTATQTLRVNATLNGTAVLFTFSAATTAPANPLMLNLPTGSQGAEACAGFQAQMSGEDCVYTPLAATLVGHPFVATSSAGTAALEFWDGCGGGAKNKAVGNQFVTGSTQRGTVPAGARCAILWEGGAGKTGTLTLVVS
jgi:hypothetical protein